MINQNQKRILLAAAVVIVAMLVYPPLQSVRNGTVYNMGYGWIFALSKRGYMTINIAMLIIQWIGVFIVGGIAFFLAKGASLPSGLSSNQSSVIKHPTETMNLTVESYAGFWKRVAASLIDGIITAIGVLLVIIWFGIMFGGGTLKTATWERMGSFLGLISCWIYYALMESSSKQATLGKMALGIKVTDLNGNRIDFGRATGRYFGMCISSIILCIGHIMVAFTQKKQGLHDIMAGCLVVNRSFEYAMNDGAAIQKIISEAEARSFREAQRTAPHVISEVKEQNEEFIELLKSTINENGLNTIPGDDLIEIYKRAKSIESSYGIPSFALSETINAVLEEIKKRGLSPENKR